jgi:hypothetical protein
MSDNLENREAEDRARVSLSEEHEVQYWTEKFGVTREELVEAVDQVGTSVYAVAVYRDRPI